MLHNQNAALSKRAFSTRQIAGYPNGLIDNLVVGNDTATISHF